MSDKFRRAMARVLEIDPHLIDGSNNVPSTIEDTLGIELEETYLVGTATAASHCRSPRSISVRRFFATAWRPYDVSKDPDGSRHWRADTKGIQIDNAASSRTSR